MAVINCEFAQSYGMSETSGTCVVLPPEDHDPAGNGRMRSAGKPLPGTRLRILDAKGNILPIGEPGEVTLHCVSMMNGYWNRPEETAQVLGKDGWYRTGDVGILDQDGYLFIRDRVKDMIVSGAENVYPAEVENVLADHPDINAVAVIGVPDERWGEAVKAVIVLKPDVRPDEGAILCWTRERLAGYKVPKSIDFIESLPLSASNKVLKAELREPYWQGHERRVN